MRLIREKITEQILIHPEKKEDIPLFKHCANGYEQVEERIFEKNVKSVLNFHCPAGYTIKNRVKP